MKNVVKIASMCCALMAMAFVLASCSDSTEKVSVETVTISADKTNLSVGGIATLTATVEPKNAYYDSVEWKSDDEILLITNAGTKAIALGDSIDDDDTVRTANVYAVIGGVKSGEIQFSVYDANAYENLTEDEKNESGQTKAEDSKQSEEPESGNGNNENNSGNGNNNGGDNSGTNSGNQGNTGGDTPAVTDNTVEKGGEDATGTLDKPTATEIPAGTSITVKEASGWFNSAYAIFEQVSGATYTVMVDDKELDAPLIRLYDTYEAYAPNENADTLAVTYSKTTYSKVVRVDALGLKKGAHTMKIRANSSSNSSDWTTLTVNVVDYDRSGFAFAEGGVPGAYNLDGTLKDGAIVIYLTSNNVNTVKVTLGDGKEYTGVKDITQAIKTKKFTTPVDIRVVGTLSATKAGELSCADLKSAWALGVKAASNVTIEGVGHDATLYGAGLAAFKDSENIEFSNLGLMKWGGGKDGDGISVKASKHVWVHNCDVFYGDAGSDGDQVKGDGSMDLKDNSQYMTISYNHFWDSGKMSLCGMKSESGPNWITYHHNWFDHSDSRHPRIRTMTVHVYNNYFDGNAKYGVGVTTGASCFVEGNFFRDAHDPMMSSGQGTDAAGGGTFSGEKGGVIKSYNNEYVQNNLYQKFQFVTNKYDWTNNRAVSEPETHTETVGTANSDGSYTIYDEKADASTNTIATSGFITVQSGASFKTDKYQVSKGKDGFTLSVPANTTKIIVKAKCGTSGASGTLSMLKVGSKTVSIDATANYTDYEVTGSEAGISSNTTITISNADKNNAMNVREIKVIATSAWATTYTTGISLSDIDAYEVDSRDDQVPATVKAKDGGSVYSNFDVALGDSGMGISVAPTDPDVAKDNVIAYSGRHHSDFMYEFDNSVDDASYAKNDTLNTNLVNYTTNVTAIQQ